MPDRSATAIARCLRNDLDELLGCLRYTSLAQRKAVRTTKTIERRFREGQAPDPPHGRRLGPHDRILFRCVHP